MAAWPLVKLMSKRYTGWQRFAATWSTTMLSTQYCNRWHVLSRCNKSFGRCRLLEQLLFERSAPPRRRVYIAPPSRWGMSEHPTVKCSKTKAFCGWRMFCLVGLKFRAGACKDRWFLSIDTISPPGATRIV